MALEERGSDGVHRQIRDINSTKISREGEVVDPGLDPEAALIAKEEEEAAEAADKGMNLKQYREWQKGRQKFNKAA